jgi:octaprenyl-diphosphate synthase
MTANIRSTAVSQADTSADNPLADIYRLVASDFQLVNELIPRRLTSDVAMVEEIGRYIVESGGKRLRPMLVLLSAQALGYKGSGHINLAAIIEFLHTATLLHDDVVDSSALRRGRATVNDRWGNAPSVLVGDFLYSRAFQLMVELASLDVMAVLARATNTIAEGEVMQLANIGNCAMTEPDYREVIRCKTALLFEAASHTGALLAAEYTSKADASSLADNGSSPEQVIALERYGLHFGMAYQLIDDWLDYAGSTELMGKNVGDDLAEGKLTLPLIQALKTGSQEDQKTIRAAIDARSCDNIESIRRIVHDSGSLEYTRLAAVIEVEKALAQLQNLPASPYRDALRSLAEYSLARLA